MTKITISSLDCILTTRITNCLLQRSKRLISDFCVKKRGRGAIAMKNFFTLQNMVVAIACELAFMTTTTTTTTTTTNNLYLTLEPIISIYNFE